MSGSNLIKSELNVLIAPEIKDDEFYYLIQKMAREESLRNVLEIGSSSGGGSTEAFVLGLKENPEKPRLFCMEVSRTRFATLRDTYRSHDFVHSYNVSSVPLEKFPTEQDVAAFYKGVKTALNNYPLEMVLDWLRQDKEYVSVSGVPEDGIQRIKRENGIDCFDMVLIDGSEFTGSAELEEVYGARYILLDDINGFKNLLNYKRLKGDINYSLVAENWNIRNGYAVFKKNQEELPIHFFTIVLNGEPYIRHHIEVFKQLRCRWHWHIVEGVAELVKDTAWSVPNGGQITPDLHQNGLSHDGTSAYLDDIRAQFPGQVTVYRKTNGHFWNGKEEMVNAPLTNICENCLLWQVDSDELWTKEQIESQRKMFLMNPERTAAYFHCYYFVGPRKYVSSLNTWATSPHDWIRVWKFLPGMRWAAHEPPVLVDLSGTNVGTASPFTRDETMSNGITFQHFAYATEAQVRFKEIYYGYQGAVAQWRQLQQSHGRVIAAHYLSWAHGDAVVEDWPANYPILLAEQLAIEPVRQKQYVSMAVDGATQFEDELRKLFQKIRPATIIETGTFLGQGTTSIIWRALRDFSIEADFTTIEVNPKHHSIAVKHFQDNSINVRAELGLTLPRVKLPTKEEIKHHFVFNKEFEGIYYDHDETVRDQLYHAETDFPVEDDLLYKTMERYDFRPSFVLLDSAGHLGFAEFKYFLELIQGDCYLMLDDVYHCKHYKTLQVIKSDPRFNVLVESKEKFGFCIARYRHIKSVLFVRTDAIGDNVLASGMLPHIRNRYPGAEITVICQDRLEQLYGASPYVDRIISFNWWKAFHDEPYRQEILARVQSVKADLALNSVYSREALNDFFAIGSFAPERIALHGDESNIREDLRDANNTAYTRIISTEGAVKPEMERHRDFLHGLGIDASPMQPLVWTTEEDERFADDFFAFHGLDPRKTVAFYPSGQWEGKFYERYPEALSGVLREKDLSVIAFGGEGERELNSRLLRELGVHGINAAGETTIRQAAALIRRCSVGIGADTGTAHIACAVGTPHVVLLWGGHFGRFFPYSLLTSIVCLPLECYGCNWKCSYSRPHCVKDIDPVVVEYAFRQTLECSSGAPRIFTQDYDSWQPVPGEPRWDLYVRFLDPRAVVIVPVKTGQASSAINFS